jgi:hypothetical protein
MALALACHLHPAWNLHGIAYAWVDCISLLGMEQEQHRIRGVYRSDAVNLFLLLLSSVQTKAAPKLPDVRKTL